MSGLAGLEARPSLMLVRRYRASPERVWRAWTDPEALRQWWGQAGSPGWVGEVDLRVGGRYRFVLRDREGGYHDVRGAFREVAPELKLAFTWSRHGAPETTSLITVLFNMLPDRGTRLVFAEEPESEVWPEGWKSAFVQLDHLLPAY